MGQEAWNTYTTTATLHMHALGGPIASVHDTRVRDGASQSGWTCVHVANANGGWSMEDAIIYTLLDRTTHVETLQKAISAGYWVIYRRNLRAVRNANKSNK